MMNRHCVECGELFAASREWNVYCSRKCQSAVYRRRNEIGIIMPRHCKQCATRFFPPNNPSGRNQQHCSETCSAKSARESRTKFWKELPNPKEKAKKYYEKTLLKNGHRSNLERFYKRHPEAAKCCQSCGEDRVLDIAHRPGHERNGAWRSAKNTTIDKVWILCPNCHALLDRMGYTPSQLNLS